MLLRKKHEAKYEQGKTGVHDVRGSGGLRRSKKNWIMETEALSHELPWILKGKGC